VNNNLTEINEIIIPGLIDVTTIDEKGIPGVEEYSDIFQTELIITMLCPEEALGLGKGSTEATASVKQMMFERVIRSFQLKISSQIENELIRKILDDNGFNLEKNPTNMVHMRFNSVTDADEAVKAKWLGNLFRGYDPRQGEIKPFTVDEVRAMFGYGPMGKMDEKEKPVAEPTEEEPENVDEEEEENNETPEEE